MTTVFASCEKEAMEINFSQTDNHVSDYSGIIKAINDQTKSLEEKLALVNEAINNQTLTVGQKLDILGAAVNNGVLTLQQMTDRLVKAIEDQTTGLNEKLALIEAAISNQTMTFSQKLALIEAAINSQTLSLSEKLALIEKAIDNQTLALEEKFDILNTAVNKGVMSLDAMVQKMTDIITSLDNISTQLEGVKSSIATLNESVKAGNLTLSQLVEKAGGIIDAIGKNTDAVTANGAKIDALNTLFTTKLQDVVDGLGTIEASNQEILTALDKMRNDQGIYTSPLDEDNKLLFVSPEVWPMLQADPTMEQMYANRMTVMENGTLQVFQTGAFGTHGVYDSERKLFSLKINSGVPGTDITKEVFACVTKVTKRVFKAWNSDTQEKTAYVTDVYGERKATKLTQGSADENGVYLFTCTISLYDPATQTWVKEYAVYGTQTENQENE